MIPITPLGERRPKSKSRSTLYREANTPGTVLYILASFFPRKGAILRQTEYEYFRLPIWAGADPKSVETYHRASTRKLKAKAGSNIANAAKQTRAHQRYLKALDLQREGLNQKQIAANLGITPRGLRKMLKRNYR